METFFCDKRSHLQPFVRCDLPALGPVRFAFSDDRCLITNTSMLPCGLGGHNSCPLILGNCSDASAVWLETAEHVVENIYWSSTGSAMTQITMDCDS